MKTLKSSTWQTLEIQIQEIEKGPNDMVEKLKKKLDEATEESERCPIVLETKAKELFTWKKNQNIKVK